MFGLAPIAGTLGGGLVYSALGPKTLFIASGVLAVTAGIVGLTAATRRRAVIEPATLVEPAALVEAPAEA